MKKTITRALLLFLTLVMAIGLLTGCSNKSTTATLEFKTDFGYTQKNNLTEDQLQAAATMLNAVNDAGTEDPSVKDQLTVAGNDTTAVYALISRMNGKADEAKQIADLTPYEKINAADIQSLVASFDTEDHIAPYGNGNQLTKDQLEKAAKLLSAMYGQGKYAKYSTQDMLIAASSGYDMTAENFDDNNLGMPGDPVALTKNLLRVLNEEIKGIDSLKANAIADFTPYESLNEYDVESLIDAFRITVDMTESSGFFDKLLQGVGKILLWITKYLTFGTNNYIIGICVFAIFIEIIMLPLAIRQQKNSIKQAKLRPKEMAIRNKYKGRNDQATQQKVTQEIQELYQRENFSPYSGCLPLLIQFPILIALYRIVVDPLKYFLGVTSTGATAAMHAYSTAAKAAGGLGNAATTSTIELLSGGAKDFEGLKAFQYYTNGADVWSKIEGKTIPGFNFFKLNMGATPSSAGKWVLWLIPILTFVVYFFSMKLSRKFTYQPTQGETTDRQVACSNTMMDITMPLMSAFFAIIVPAVVGVYWIFRSVLGTLKQYIMSRVMPLPKFTEEDYKAAAKELAGKKPKTQKSENAGKVRSLHHIDDEDFDDTRERGLKMKEAIAEREAAEKEKRAGKSPVGGAELKEDKADVSKAKPKKAGQEDSAADRQESQPDETKTDDGEKEKQ